MPEKKLLVFDPKDGWAPLCKFLDRPIPKTPFPLVNEDEMDKLAHKSVSQDEDARGVEAGCQEAHTGDNLDRNRVLFVELSEVEEQGKRKSGAA